MAQVPLCDAWLIWSYEHNAWWGAAFGGYRRDVLFAGLYTKEAAEAECGKRYLGARPDEEARRFVDEFPKRTAMHGNRVGDVLGDMIAVALMSEDAP